jgi:hypothetical protein
MELTNKIIWQKWLDPFGNESDDTEHDPYTGNYYDEEHYNDTEEEEDEDEILKKNLTKNKQVKVIATPMGIIPMNENTMSGKIFNFWMGHTNFNITKKVADIIEQTDGVETLDIFTRYRFRIGVGKAFDDSSVMRTINKRVYGEINHA